MIELTIALILEFLIIVGLLVAFSWYVRENLKDKTKLLNGILAKNSQEYVERTLADQTEVVRPDMNPRIDPDLINMDTMDDEAFDKHIQQTLGNELTDQEIV